MLKVEGGAKLSGTVRAPPSKSHTHRAVTIASLASGESVIQNPLACDDCLATIEACRQFGAEITGEGMLKVRGVGGCPQAPKEEINARDSGTTMRFMTAVSALCDGTTRLNGDASLCIRPIGELLASLRELGARKAISVNGDGCPPVTIYGRMKGGRTSVGGASSQFVSALLLSCPLADEDSSIDVRTLRSKPYVQMTLDHLMRAGAKVEQDEFKKFTMRGGQAYKSFRFAVPGDHSAAAFLKTAEMVTDSRICITGLDPEDAQGDRAVDGFIAQMRTGVRRDLDLRDTPDLLPALAVAGCFAHGETVLSNVPQAREKESDRISAICAELRKMGADITEKPDGLTVRNSKLAGAKLDGHGDHRIVMALAVAGLGADGTTAISGAETIPISYPNFVGDLMIIGARVRMVAD